MENVQVGHQEEQRKHGAIGQESTEGDESHLDEGQRRHYPREVGKVERQRRAK